MLHFFYLLFIAIVFACGNSGNIGNKQESIDSRVFPDTIFNNQTNWPENIYNKIKGIENKFIKKNIRNFNCSDIAKYYFDNGTKINAEGLTQVDSNLCKQLFGSYRGEYCGSYLFSIGRPIHKFYPITVIKYFGVTETPLIMVLFTEGGQIVNTLEVANLYGEGGECLNSEFINDSTLILTYQWNSFGIDTVTNKDVWESEFLSKQVIITQKGEFIEKELKRWIQNQNQE